MNAAMRGRVFSYSVRVGLLGALYFGAAKVGLSLDAVSGFATAVWPPTGLALAALTLGGYRLWPGVALAAFLVNVSAGAPLLAAAGMALGNTLEALLGTYLLREVAGFRPGMDRLRDVAGLVVLAAGLSTLVSASIGVTSGWWGGVIAAAHYPQAWWTWWLGDVLGALVVAPLLLVWSQCRGLQRSLWQLAEYGAWLIAFGMVGLLIFSGMGGTDTSDAPYLFFPILIWAALRFGLPGAVTATALMSLIVIWGTAEGWGPFVRETLQGSLRTVQAFMGITAVTTLVLAAAIAERLRTEAALRDSEERLRLALQAGHLGTWAWDIATGLVTWSTMLETIHGLAPGTFGGTYEAFLADVHPEDRAFVRDTIAATLAARNDHHIAYRIVHPDGRIRWVEGRGQLFRDDTGQPVRMLGACLDITERQHAEEALRQAHDELERRVQARTAELVEANVQLQHEMSERQQAEAELRLQQEASHQREKLAAMGALLASVAHELNNPLAIVMMQADLLREESRDGLLAEHTWALTQAAERCMRIVQKFLTLARQHPQERHVISLNTIIEEALELLTYTLRVDDVEMELRLASDLPMLWADPDQLQQLVVNLVTNAHQALLDVPPPRRLTITTGFDPERACVSFEVADTGTGVPPALQARIFEPFFTTKPPGVGTGLGLSLCRRIVEGHGGTITVQSQPGRGTIFHVVFPVDAEPRPAAAAPCDEAALPSDVQPAAILVIDDEPAIANALAHLLHRSGHVVETATNGRLALAKLEHKTYDLILCDLRMPELDGPGLYRELALRHPQLLSRIIFLTGDTLSPEACAFLEQTGVTRLNKPFRLAEVRRAVQQALRSL